MGPWNVELRFASRPPRRENDGPSEPWAHEDYRPARWTRTVFAREKDRATHHGAQSGPNFGTQLAADSSLWVFAEFVSADSVATYYSMELVTGIEPVTPSLRVTCSTS